MTPYERLASGIILQAVKDYREALQDLRINPSYPDALRTVSDVERFFCSGWFSFLISADGVVLMEKFRKEHNEK